MAYGMMEDWEGVRRAVLDAKPRSRWRCPRCGGFPLLEPEGFFRYVWTCLNCGWRRDARGTSRGRRGEAP